MTLDPAADITDVYAFVSYNTATWRAPPVTEGELILTRDPPRSQLGPNYFAFDDNVLYSSTSTTQGRRR